MQEKYYLINQIIAEKKLDKDQAEELRKSLDTMSLAELTMMLSNNKTNFTSAPYKLEFQVFQDYGLTVEKSEQTQVPLRPKDVFWENIASKPEKLEQYLKKFDQVSDIDKMLITNDINEKNAALFKNFLENIPQDMTEDKISLALTQLADLDEKNIDLMTDLCKTKHKRVFDSYFMYQLDENQVNKSRLKKLIPILEADKDGRIDIYTLDNLCGIDLSSEMTQSITKMVSKKNSIGEYKYDDSTLYSLLAGIKDKKYNPQIIDAITDNDNIKINSDETYKLKELAQKNTEVLCPYWQKWKVQQ